MAPKLLFFLGIVIAHGALAAGWLSDESPRARRSPLSCVNAPASPSPLPFISPPRELLAMRVTTVDEQLPTP
jgi:hypothetical protein